MNTHDAVCEINVLAKMYDYGYLDIVPNDGKKVLDGALFMEIETGQGGYMIERAVWPVGEN